MTKIKYLLFFSFFIHFVNFVTAQTGEMHEVKHDTRHITVRKVTHERLEEYRNNTDFQYDREVPPPKEGFFALLWYKLMRWLSQEVPNKVLKILFRILILVAVVWAISRILKVDFLKLFYKGGNKTEAEITIEEENIHELDLDKIITTEIQQKNYRRAIRYMYLKLLKVLTDNDFIEWKLNKTNHEYFEELKKSNYLDDFNHLTWIYEYIWYGNFTVSDSFFEPTKNEFYQTYEKIINKKKIS